MTNMILLAGFRRIVSAGAQVTENGRINNGLNLSRAFGM